MTLRQDNLHIESDNVDMSHSNTINKKTHMKQPETTEFNEIRPLYVCKNVYVVDNECKYVHCSSCYKLPGCHACKSRTMPGKCQHQACHLHEWTEVRWTKRLCEKNTNIIPTMCSHVGCKKIISINGCPITDLITK